MRDPIVEEIHQARQKLLDECGGDLDKLIERSRAREAPHQDRIVTLEMFQKRHGVQRHVRKTKELLPD